MRMLLLGMTLGFLLSALVVVVPMVLAQGTPPPLQELIPLPGPGQQQPGQAPQPGQGDCPILFYFNGRLYQLAPGPDQGPGRPTSPPEFFYLNPYQGPPIPGLPQPFQGPPGPPGGPGPNFVPVPPRS